MLSRTGRTDRSGPELVAGPIWAWSQPFPRPLDAVSVRFARARPLARSSGG
jgi:hypothetical protein